MGPEFRAMTAARDAWHVIVDHWTDLPATRQCQFLMIVVASGGRSLGDGSALFSTEASALSCISRAAGDLGIVLELRALERQP